LKDIFTLDEKSSTFTPDITWTKQGDGTFIDTYDAAELGQFIKLNGNTILDTKADHDHFRTNHLTGTIIAYVTDGQTPANP